MCHKTKPNQTIYYFTPCKFFFKRALTGDLLIVWVSVCSNHRDSSQYTSRSQQYYSRGGLRSSTNSSYSSSSFPILWWPFQVHQKQLISPSFSCSSFFFNFFAFFYFSLSGRPKWQNSQDGKSFFFNFIYLFIFISFLYNYLIWSSGQNYMIRFFLKIPENSMSLIFLDGFWFVYITLSSMFQIQSLAKFPVRRLSHLSSRTWSCILSSEFTAFACYVVNRFIFFST